MKRLIAILCSLLICTAVLGSVSADDADSAENDLPQKPALVSADTTNRVPTDTPELILNYSGLVDWELSNSTLYYNSTCAGGEFRGTSLLRRASSSGGSTFTTIQTEPADDCVTYLYMASDNANVYWWDDDEGLIERRTPGYTSGAEEVAFIGTTTVKDLDVDDESFDGYVYFSATDNRIRRVRKDGTGGVQSFAYTSTGLGEILVSGNSIYWIDNGGLKSADLSCATPCGSVNHTILDTAAEGNNLHRGDTFLFSLQWRDTASTNERIRSYGCFFFLGTVSCNTSTLYTVAAGSGTEIGEITSVDGDFYWREVTSVIADSKVKRLSGGTLTTIADLLPWQEGIAVDRTHVYFRYGSGLGRLPHDASALNRDLAVDEMEVTQAIQNLDNDTPLVADKDTFVRVYGRQDDGTRANIVEMEVRAYTNSSKSSELSASPLTPLRGQNYLAVGDGYDRGSAESGWLFQLPANWTTSGSVYLCAKVDPRDLYEDTVSGNNELCETITFNNEPNVCVVTMPIQTHTPLPRTSDPNFAAMVDRFSSMTPYDDTIVLNAPIPIRELEFCPRMVFGFPPCRGPLELDQKEYFPFNDGFIHDRDAAMASLMIRYVATIATFAAPTQCGLGTAQIHYMGMVHRDADTTDDDAGTTLGGYANYYVNTSFVKSPDAAPFDPTGSRPEWAWPQKGSTMAQELVHNYDRRHIGCLVGAEDSSWPYPGNECNLDVPGPTAHYGFDPISLQPIPPENAADFMTYASNRWVSDYTWEGVMGVSSFLPRREATFGGDTVLVTGIVEQVSGEGRLGSVTVIPSSVRNSEVLGIDFDSLLESREHTHDDGRAVTATYYVRFLGAGDAVLQSETIAFADPDVHDGAASASPFFMQVAAPTGQVHKVQIVDDSGNIVDSWEPGLNTPTVEIHSPTSGDAFTNSMLIEWTGTDVDNDLMQYQVHYSPDGYTWNVVSHLEYGVSGEKLTLLLDKDQLASMPGTQQGIGLVRVTASDGYNTTVETSEVFTLANRPPRADIITPAVNEWFEADETIVLRGTSQDAEDGPLPDSQFSWDIDGSTFGTGQTLDVSGLKPGHYDVDLAVTDYSGASEWVSAEFDIAPLEIPEAAKPVADGYCSDSAYGDAVMLPLERYSDGTRPVAYMLRTANSLFICFEGMKQGATSQSYVRLNIDPDHSREANAQSDDFTMVLYEDGDTLTRVGNGAGSFSVSASGTEWNGQSIFDGSHWHAEIEIPASTLGGWDHQMALGMYQWYSGAAHGWPLDASMGDTASWGTVNLGDAPEITGVSPVEMPVGGNGLLTVDGSGFDGGSSIVFDGVTLATTYVSGSRLTANLTAAQLAQAETTQVSVAGGGARSGSRSAEFSSTPVPFRVYNPTPVATSLSPANVGPGASGFTLTLNGSDFVPGSVIYFNGDALTTTYVNGTTLTAPISADYLTDGRTYGVAVHNPNARDGSSDVLTFTITVPTSVAGIAQDAGQSPVMITLLTMALTLLLVMTVHAIRRGVNG